MIAASVLGLPAILLLLTVLPCIRMGHEPGVAKYRRAQLAGVLLILLGKLSLWCPDSGECEESQTSLLLLQEKCEKNSKEPTGGRNPHLYPLRSYSRGSLGGTLTTAVRGTHRV